jgi:hypothetical protein
MTEFLIGALKARSNLNVPIGRGDHKEMLL